MYHDHFTTRVCGIIIYVTYYVTRASDNIIHIVCFYFQYRFKMIHTRIGLSSQQTLTPPCTTCTSPDGKTFSPCPHIDRCQRELHPSSRRTKKKTTRNTDAASSNDVFVLHIIGRVINSSFSHFSWSRKEERECVIFVK